MELSNFFAARFDSGSIRRPRGLAAIVGSQLVRALQRGLPQSCVLCAAPSGGALVCAGCRDALPCIGLACPACGLPRVAAVPSLAKPALCGACLARPPPYAATIAAWTYEFPIDQLLQAFKYGGVLALAEPLSEALSAAVRRRADTRADAVVALPLAPARQRQRGFNQAHEIARRVAVSLRLPLVRGLARVRDSPPQATLAWADRARNVRRAFVGEATLRGRRIAIVDDVMTTGATLSAAAGAALRAGALAVEAWVVARTPPPMDAGG